MKGMCSDFVQCVIIVCLLNVLYFFFFNAGNLENPWVAERSENLVGVAILRKTIADH